MKNFRDFIMEKKLVDLFLAIRKGEDEVRKQWPNLSYKGINIFDLYKKNYKMLQDEGKTIMEDYKVITDFSSQEVYLGYSPKEDKFYSGWDCLVTEEIDNPNYDEDDENGYEDEYIEEDLNGNIIQSFKIKRGKITDLETSTDLSGIFYNNKGSGYNLLKKNKKDLIDIKLN